jgi:hypothetical protein
VKNYYVLVCGWEGRIGNERRVVDEREILDHKRKKENGGVGSREEMIMVIPNARRMRIQERWKQEVQGVTIVYIS